MANKREQVACPICGEAIEIFQYPELGAIAIHACKKPEKEIIDKEPYYQVEIICLHCEGLGYFIEKDEDGEIVEYDCQNCDGSGEV